MSQCHTGHLSSKSERVSSLPTVGQLGEMLSNFLGVALSAGEKPWCCERCREAARGRREGFAKPQTEAVAGTPVPAPTARSRQALLRLVPLASMTLGSLGTLVFLAARL